MTFKLSHIFKTRRIDSSTSTSTLKLKTLSLKGVIHILTMSGFWGTIILIPFRLRLFAFPRPHPPIYADFTDFILFASDILMLMTIILWALSIVLEPEHFSFRPLSLTLPLVGITLFSLLSVPFSIDVNLSLYHLIRMILLFGFYLFVVNTVKNLKLIIIPVAIQISIQAIVAIVQVLGQHSIGLFSLGELQVDPSWNGVSIVWAEGIRSLRAYGLTDHPNILGGCLAFGLIFIISHYLSTNSKRPEVVVAIYSLGSLGLFYTFSRAAWLAAGIGTMVHGAWLFRNKKIKQIKSLLGLLTAGFIFTVPFIWHNLPYLGVRLNHQDSFTHNTYENRAISERLQLNEIANEIFLTKPLTGVGVGAFPLAMQAHRPDYPYNYQPAHIVLIDVASETGIFGGLFYLILITSPWAALWVNRHRLDFTPSLIGVSALLLATTLIGFFDYYTWFLTPGRLWQWLVWGLWAGIYQRSLREVRYA